MRKKFIYILIFIGTASTSFTIVWGWIEPAGYLGFNNLKDTGWIGLTLMISAALNVASLLTYLTYVIFNRPDEPPLAPDAETTQHLLASVLAESGITAIFPNRDYYKNRGHGLSSISGFIGQANRSLTIVSITFIKARDHEGVLSVIKDKLNENDRFQACISLINPEKLAVLEALCANFGKTKFELRADIQKALGQLKEFRDSLSESARARFQIHRHNSIPFASAIIIDDSTDTAKIQLETKAYNAPFDKSFALEAVPTRNKNGFYQTLVNGYRNLLEDGEPVIN